MIYILALALAAFTSTPSPTLGGFPEELFPCEPPTIPCVGILEPMCVENWEAWYDVTCNSFLQVAVATYERCVEAGGDDVACVRMNVRILIAQLGLLDAFYIQDAAEACCAESSVGVGVSMDVGGPIPLPDGLVLV